MSTIISMRILVKRECAAEFLDAFSWGHLVVYDIYDDEKGWEFFIQPERMGNAEPLILYEKVKDYVHDIHYIIFGDDEIKPNVNERSYPWLSCKLESKFDDKDYVLMYCNGCGKKTFRAEAQAYTSTDIPYALGKCTECGCEKAKVGKDGS